MYDVLCNLDDEMPNINATKCLFEPFLPQINTQTNVLNRDDFNFDDQKFLFKKAEGIIRICEAINVDKRVFTHSPINMSHTSFSSIVLYFAH